jgi:multidrug efflux pump subunit AcrB
MKRAFARQGIVVLGACVAFLLSAGCGQIIKGPPVAEPLPTIVVEAVYPGANARTVADTVAAPIEQQVDGVEGLVHLESRSTDDGKYTLAVTFKAGTDPKIAQVLVQNRVALAQPVLPALVQNQGVSVKRLSLNPAMILILRSEEGQDKVARYDERYLANYARIQLRDELARLPGVGEITILGPGEPSLRLWLDPDKLAARNMTVTDVIAALREQKLQVAAGQIGQPPAAPGAPLILAPKGRLNDPEQINDIVVKTSPEGRVVKIKDIGRVELQAADGAQARLNGKPCVAVGVYPLPGTKLDDLSRTVKDTVAKFRDRAPDGLHIETAFDFAPQEKAEHLVLDLELPDSASRERAREVLAKCDDLLSKEPGVRDRLDLTENPFGLARQQACILVSLTAADQRKATRDEILRTVRTTTGEKIQEATVRVRPLVGTGDYPVRLAVAHPEGGKELAELTENFAGRLKKIPGLADAWARRDFAARPRLYVEVDRAKCNTLGVALADVFTTLQIALGKTHVGDFQTFGRTAWISVAMENAEFRNRVDDLKSLKVRNNKAEMVPLGTLANFRDTDGPGVVLRVDLQPAVEVLVTPAAETTPKQVREVCEAVFAKEFPQRYRLIWLRGP